MQKHPIEHEDVEAMLERLGNDATVFEGKTVLISGGAGFLGRHFISLLQRLNNGILRQPCTIISIDNYSSQTSEYDRQRFNDVRIIEEWADVTLPLPERTDVHYIIHAAGYTSPMHHKKLLLPNLRAAIWGTYNLLEFARKNKNLEGFLFLSSSDVYGEIDAQSVPTPENYRGVVSSNMSRSANEEAKRVGETLTNYYALRYNLPATIVRPFHIYGPGMRHDDRRVIPHFTYEGLNGRPLPVYGDGEARRAHCYITDAIPPMLRVLLHGQRGQCYNVGNSTAYVSVNDLARILVELMPGASFQYTPYHELYPGGEPAHSAPNIDKLTKLCGYEPRIGINEGISRFVAWAKDQDAYHARTTIENADIIVQD